MSSSANGRHFKSDPILLGTRLGSALGFRNVVPVLLIQEPSWIPALSDGRLRFFPRMTWLRIALRDAASGLAFVEVTKMKGSDGCFTAPPGDTDTLTGGRTAEVRNRAIGSMLECPMARGVQMPGPASEAMSRTEIPSPPYRDQRVVGVVGLLKLLTKQQKQW